MVQVAVVTHTVREVDIPDECPHCSADLTKPGALIVFELECQELHARIKDNQVDWDGHARDSGDESGIPPIEYQCKWCRAVLAGDEGEDDEA